MTKPDKAPHLHRGRKWGKPAADAPVYSYEVLRVGTDKWEAVSWQDMKLSLKESGCRKVRAGEVVESCYRNKYRLKP